jgi:hypothetical protein
MIRSGAFLFFVALVSAAPNARADRVFSAQFTISGTSGFNGVDAATLTLSKSKLSGTVEVISPGPVTYPCTVNSNSTLIRRKLNLTCTIGPDEVVTLSGTLSPATDKGRGTFSETFFEEDWTYKATAGDR